MKGKLIKRGKGHYDLYTEKELYTSTYQWTRIGNLLSSKNCQAIENGYDLEEYEEGIFYAGKFGHPSPEGFSDEQVGRLHGFIDGFQKAMELMEGKKYSEMELYRAFLINSAGNNMTLEKMFTETVLPTFQQTEWEVEIVTEPKEQAGENVWCEPKLDKDGCLILKRV